MQFYKSKTSNSPKTIFFTSFVLLIVVLLAFTSCSQKSEKQNQIIVVGISSDVATINPLYAFNLQEGHLMDLLYLKPALEVWNDSSRNY